MFLRALRMFLFTDALFVAPGFFVEPFFASFANHRACGTAVARKSIRERIIIYNFCFLSLVVVCRTDLVEGMAESAGSLTTFSVA